MKTLITSLLLAAATVTAFAQTDQDSNRRKGFIGISLGPSLPVGSFAKVEDKDGAAGGGLHLNLINFGYRFSDKVGITAKYFGGANVIKLEKELEREEENFEPWNYGGLLAGPMVSVPLSNSVEVDFRPMVGFCAAMLPKHKSEREAKTSEASLAYSLGVNFQFNVASRFGIHAGLDYFHTKSEFTGSESGIPDFTQKISTVTPNVAFVYRFN